MMVKMTILSIDYQTFTLYQEMVLKKMELDMLRFMTGDEIRAIFVADEAYFDILKKEGHLQ